MQICDSQQVAEDLVQESIKALWERRIQFTHVAKLKAYLYNSVRNKSIDYLRKQRGNVVDIDSVEAFSVEFTVDDEGCEGLFKEEVYRHLFQLIDQLPQRQRQVFLLLMEGRSNDEIAEMLNMSAETVRTHRKRALHFLKDNLNEDDFMFILFLIGIFEI